LTYFAVQVVILKTGNSFQSSSISFAYVATPSSKESLQLFRVVVAMFLEEGKCCRVVGEEVLLV